MSAVEVPFRPTTDGTGIGCPQRTQTTPRKCLLSADWFMVDPLEKRPA
jgi:hypothetical protein